VDAINKPSVFLVDDEEMVITSVRAFLLLETDFVVHGFTNPQLAAKELETTTADVVVSDYLMPRMNGIELLTHARKLQPEASRVLLTGHADKQSAIQAINDVGLFQYLEKPWDNEQMLLILRNAIERTRLLRTLASKISELDAAQDNLKSAQARLIRAFM
jgi:DNA-binding NtrC family response regulator